MGSVAIGAKCSFPSVSLVQVSNLCGKFVQRLRQIRISLLCHPFITKITLGIRRRAKRYLGWPYTAGEYLERILVGKHNVRFVQVGSNDGRFGDPIAPLIKEDESWSGIFIEPVPYAFERLKDHYGNADRFTFEQLAIGEEFEKKTFYYVSEEAKNSLGSRLPPWYDQLGSFERGHIVKHLDGMLAPYIVEADIQCVPLSYIFEKNAVQSIDLLHIDTEGFDYRVLRQFDISKYKPPVILFEHKHLPSEELKQAYASLLAHRYRIKVLNGDTLALLRAGQG